MALEGSNPRLHYGDPAAEALACRTNCALFDFSFLECARLKGAAAQAAAEAFCSRPLGSLEPGKIRYALRLGADHAAISDLTVWKRGPGDFEVMSGRREDIDDLLRGASATLDVTDLGRERAVFAVQGPDSFAALEALGAAGEMEKLEYFGFIDTELRDIRCIVARLGYTGEQGFEIVCDRGRAQELWGLLARHARPAGFVAMDALRIEAGFVLFTNEFLLRPTPAEIGLQKFCEVEAPPRIRLVAFQAEAGDFPPPWQPPATLRRPSRAGEIAITSACRSAASGGVLGLGFVLAGIPVTERLEDRSGVFREIRPVPLPFHDSGKLRPRAPWRRRAS